jgi:hypothetical protein
MKSVEINDANKFGMLTVEKLEEFEQNYGIKLPDDYRSFLLRYNGGSPEPGIVDFVQYGDNQSDIVNYLCGIHNGEYWASLEWYTQTYKGRIPVGFIPFGYDPGGNLYLLGIDGIHLGKVYFWDHENEAGLLDEEPSFENMSFIANSFAEFLSKLRAE